MTAQKAIKKLLAKAKPAGSIHFSAQLCLSIGHLRMKEYEEVVKALAKVISLCGQNINGLCDALIVLAEAYSAVGSLDEALHSARLAVDVAHDKLESQQKPQVVHMKVRGRNEHFYFIILSSTSAHFVVVGVAAAAAAAAAAVVVVVVAIYLSIHTTNHLSIYLLLPNSSSLFVFLFLLMAVNNIAFK